MNDEKKKHYKELLLKERRDLLYEINYIVDEESRSLKDSTGELSSYDNHPADQGTNTYEREKDLGLKDNSQVILEKVDTALQLLANDEYGICKKCGKEISEYRLDAIPYTWYCKECGEKEEETESIRERPVEEESLNSSFANYGNNVVNEGEDAWEDVAQYGTSNTSQDE